MMKMCVRIWLAVIAVTVTCLPANAAILVSGDTIDFNGPGTYTARILATADGQAEEIGGFNISVDASNPNLSFESLIYGDAFESILPANAGDNPVQLQGTDTSFAGLSLADGQSGTLATLTFIVNAASEAPISLPFGDEVSDVFFGSISATVTGPISFVDATVIPEPSGLALCSLGVFGYVARRRRR